MRKLLIGLVVVVVACGDGSGAQIVLLAEAGATEGAADAAPVEAGIEAEAAPARGAFNDDCEADCPELRKLFESCTLFGGQFCDEYKAMCLPNPSGIFRCTFPCDGAVSASQDALHKLCAKFGGQCYGLKPKDVSLFNVKTACRPIPK